MDVADPVLGLRVKVGEGREGQRREGDREIYGIHKGIKLLPIPSISQAIKQDPKLKNHLAAVSDLNFHLN